MQRKKNYGSGDFNTWKEKHFYYFRITFCSDLICNKILMVTFTNCVQRIWVVKVYFLLEKQTFNEILKVIGIQMSFIHNQITSPL